MPLTIKENQGSIFQTGSRFPEISGSSICLQGKSKFEGINIEITKKKILDYLKTHNRIRISEISSRFDIHPRLVGRILRQLEEEGIIKEVD